MLSVPEPVIALLGPKGAGKTTALETLSRECGGTLVHALLDFAVLKTKQHQEPPDPIAAVAYVAFEFTRSWTNLPHDPTFHRVGLSLLALNERLPDDRGAARTKIKELIKDYGRQPRPAWVEDTANAAITLSLSLTGIAATPLGQAVQVAAKPAIAALLRLSGRRDRNRAERWISGLPQAEQRSTLDSLIALSRHRGNALDHMMAALLADLVDNAAQWPIPVKKCECRLPQPDQEHSHAWLLLLDNIGDADSDCGWRFLAALIKARRARVSAAGPATMEHDPLLVVAAVDRWTSTWRQWWREPWHAKADSPAQQPIPLLSNAAFETWTRHAACAGEAADQARAWFPVWLDPADAAELATLAPASDGHDDTFATFVRQLSGGLPSAAIDIGKQVAAMPQPGFPRPLARWEQALRANLPPDLLQRPFWRTIPEAVAVVSQLLEPDQPADDLDADTFPDAARILRLLRENLWISTFNPDLANPLRPERATMHPWLMSLLLAGLAEESKLADRRPGALTWDSLFRELATTRGEPAGANRKLFYNLACDKFTSVIDELVRWFTVDSHEDWVRLLVDVTAAPCPRPAIATTAQAVEDLAPDDEPGRTTLRASVSTLVAILWLYGNPLTVPDHHWDKKIHDSFMRLANNDSARADVTALTDAAAAFSR